MIQMSPPGFISHTAIVSVNINLTRWFSNVDNMFSISSTSIKLSDQHRFYKHPKTLSKQVLDFYMS